MDNELRIVISGGGTGGHIFPAVSIANAIKAKRPEAKILFVGALGRMEMQRVPAAGYEIKGLPVRGLIRPLWSPKNIGVLIDYLKSKGMAKKIIKDFKPMAAVGVGGYASGATLDAAHALGIPLVCRSHVGYEVHHFQHLHVIVGCHFLHDALVVVFAGLPYELHSRLLYLLEMSQYALVNGACSKAATHNEYRLLLRVESELFHGILMAYFRVHDILSDGISRHHYLVSREETLHAVVGNAYLVSLRRKHLVGFSCV